MGMSYTNNPNMGKVRADAVRMVRKGRGVREVARHFGYSPGTITKWCQKTQSVGLMSLRSIPTEPSRPKHHPNELPKETVKTILDLRRETGRGAEFIHQLLLKKGVYGASGKSVSLSSVKRTLSRHNLTKYSKWKKWHKSSPRPLPERPGLLVETDTIHDGPGRERLYVYTLIDVYSRWAYAEATDRINNVRSTEFIYNASKLAPFDLRLIQSDHGPEFSKFFIKKLAEPSLDIGHRYTRIRKPNDNAHIERFNRTIQDECIKRVSRNLKRWQEEIPKYIRYYNHERMHMGIDWKTPLEMLNASP
jgi:transposase InsO family protein